jgi:Domain of unknown function (DUF4190)
MTDPIVPESTPEPTPEPTPAAYAPPAAPAYSAAPGYGAVPAAPRTNVLAIVGFILSFFVTVAGIVVSFIALSQIKRTGEGGHGLALAGVILGFVFSFFWIIYFIVIAVVIFAGVASNSSTY